VLQYAFFFSIFGSSLNILRTQWVEPPIPIGPNYDPQELLSQLDKADISLERQLPSLPVRNVHVLALKHLLIYVFQSMGVPPLPCPPFLALEPLPLPGIGYPPPFSIPASMIQEPPPPYTPGQFMNQSAQFNGAPGGAVNNRVPIQGIPLTGNAPLWDSRMLPNGYINSVNGPAIPGTLCNCNECRGVGR
jgi:hypothetical protein